jgi:hypothetical protein
MYAPQFRSCKGPTWYQASRVASVPIWALAPEVSVCQHLARCPRSYRPIALRSARDYDLCPTTTSRLTLARSAETADREHSVHCPYHRLSCSWPRSKRNGENGTRPISMPSRGRFHGIWTRIAECRRFAKPVASLRETKQQDFHGKFAVKISLLAVSSVNTQTCAHGQPGRMTPKGRELTKIAAAPIFSYLQESKSAP